MKILDMFKESKKKTMLKSLIKQCEEKINSLRVSEKPLKLYTFNDSARKESRSDIEREISAYRYKIKQLEELKEDWSSLQEFDKKCSRFNFDKNKYEDLLEIELKYKHYKFETLE